MDTKHLFYGRGVSSSQIPHRWSWPMLRPTSWAAPQRTPPNPLTSPPPWGWGPCLTRRSGGASLLWHPGPCLPCWDSRQSKLQCGTNGLFHQVPSYFLVSQTPVPVTHPGHDIISLLSREKPRAMFSPTTASELPAYCPLILCKQQGASGACSAASDTIYVGITGCQEEGQWSGLRALYGSSQQLLK